MASISQGVEYRVSILGVAWDQSDPLAPRSACTPGCAGRLPPLQRPKKLRHYGKSDGRNLVQEQVRHFRAGQIVVPTAVAQEGVVVRLAPERSGAEAVAIVARDL